MYNNTDERRSDMYIWLNNRNAKPDERGIFKTTLSSPIDLAAGEIAKIAIKEICLPKNWYNIESKTWLKVYDTPDRTSEITVEIPKGYYPEYKEFGKKIQKTLAELDKDLKVKKTRATGIIDFNRVDSAFRPYMLLASGFGIELSEKLRLKLGLDFTNYDNEISGIGDGDERVYFPEMDMHRNHHSCIIACPMVRPVICQNTSQRILRIIPARKPVKEEMIYETFDPIYHEITSNRIYYIEVTILGQNYKPLEFGAGEGWVLLHLTFTKKQI